MAHTSIGPSVEKCKIQLKRVLLNSGAGTACGADVHISTRAWGGIVGRCIMRCELRDLRRLMKFYYTTHGSEVALYSSNIVGSVEPRVAERQRRAERVVLGPRSCSVP